MQYESNTEKLKALDETFTAEVPGGIPCVTGLGGVSRLQCLHKVTKVIVYWEPRAAMFIALPKCEECAILEAKNYGLIE